MKISLTKALLFIITGIVLFIISMTTRNVLTEKWTSFALGFSFPLFVAGIIALVIHLKQAGQQNQQ